MTGSSGLRRSAVCALVLVPIELIVAACAQHPSVTTTPLATAAVTAAAAKQQMVGAVDDLTGRLGGDWEQGTGPDYAEACRLPDGDTGAKWTYFLTRAQTGDVSADAAKVEARWKDRGMSIDHLGTKAEPTVIGRGGDHTDSISFSVAPGLYVIQSVSLCFPGDADQL